MSEKAWITYSREMNSASSWIRNGDLVILSGVLTIKPIIVWKPFLLANSVDLDQMPQNAASDQGLHCLQMV